MSVSAPTVDWVRGRERGADDMALCRTRSRSANCSERQTQKKTETEKPALAHRCLHTLLHLCLKLFIRLVAGNTIVSNSMKNISSQKLLYMYACLIKTCYLNQCYQAGAKVVMS